MIRTQIQLTEEQANALRKRAKEEQRSLADLIRCSVDDYLARPRRAGHQARYRRALDVIGKYDSRRHDVSSRHDAYLSEAYRG